MRYFLQENARAIIAMAFMALWWAGIGFLSIRGDMKTFDQKRLAKGLSAMTDDEKLLLKQTLRLSNTTNLIAVLVAGIVGIVVLYIL